MTKTHDSLGNRIQARRKSAGLSLRELAAKTDLTASFISQVERCQTNPSIDSLRRIAEALQVSILYFLSDHTRPQPKMRAPKSKALAYVPTVRAHARPQLTLPVSGVTYELLTPDLAHKMEAVCGRLAPGAGNVARRLREPTEEFIYVLSGALCVGLDAGEQILRPGDSIYFAGTTLHKLACASKEDAVWISVITPPVF
ncbi:MAG: helix-turn-helix transcriptional regulator [Chloroflexi bacterium]|nr:helix-turn-helix transcriptional regulator [Chloroflexota bacterium]